ncbi:MAG: F0F1 ATP synthase subunit B [Erysipelotrichaceae bacterium]|nr:F0F1 ATP synthase subunit B [Erysipelotrichaceae bacterium]
MLSKISLDIDILAQLLPNPLTIITQLCATGVLVFALYKLLWKPVKNIIETRSAYEQERLEKAQAIIDENEKGANQAEAIVADARKQGRRIVEDAQAEGIKIKNQLIEEGQDQAKEIIRQANEQAREQKSRMLQTVQEEMVDVALLATRKMLQQQLDGDKQHETVEEFVKEVKNR